MTDQNLRTLERAYEATPNAETVTAYRQAQLRSGVALADLTPAPEVYLSYSEYFEGGEVDEGGWDHADEHCFFDPLSLQVTRHSDNWRNETIPVNFLPEVGQEVFFIYVDYDTGSTFGRLLNRWNVVGVVKSRDQVDKVVHEIETYNNGGVDYMRIGESIKEITGNKHFYACWQGYFERYNDTVIVPFTLRTE